MISPSRSGGLCQGFLFASELALELTNPPSDNGGVPTVLLQRNPLALKIDEADRRCTDP